jgi:hypothetical protein
VNVKENDREETEGQNEAEGRKREEKVYN